MGKKEPGELDFLGEFLAIICYDLPEHDKALVKLIKDTSRYQAKIAGLSGQEPQPAGITKWATT